MSYLVQGCIGEEPVHWFIIANAVPLFTYFIYIYTYMDIWPVCLSVKPCAAWERGQLQLHTYAHNMHTKNLKALCYKAA